MFAIKYLPSVLFGVSSATEPVKDYMWASQLYPEASARVESIFHAIATSGDTKEFESIFTGMRHHRLSILATDQGLGSAQGGTLTGGAIFLNPAFVITDPKAAAFSLRHAFHHFQSADSLWAALRRPIVSAVTSYVVGKNYGTVVGLVAGIITPFLFEIGHHNQRRVVKKTFLIHVFIRRS